MKRFLSLLLSVVIVLSSFSCLTITSASAVSKTRDDAVNWANSQIGNYIDVDGAYGNQCVDLIMAYYQYLGVSRVSGNGCDYAYNSLPDGWTRIQNTPDFVPQPGDIVVWTDAGWKNGHVAIFLSGDTSSFVSIDQNWPKGSVCKKVTHNYNYVWGVIRPNFTSQEPPKNPTISKNQVWYDLKDTIEIRAYADNATSYYMSMFKDGNRIKGENLDNGIFTMSASDYGTGNYSAYFSCSNSLDSVDTSWIDFAVVGEPSYSDVYTSSWWYDLSDIVTISVDTVCAKGQVIGIDKVGTGRIITEQCDSTFTIPSSQLGVGEYSAYFSVYNGSGGIDTKYVTFEIVDKPKDGAVVTSPKKSYTLDDMVEISVLAYCTKGRVIGIDKEGVGRVVTENCGTTYTISASQLGRGKYSAYFSVYNGSGGYDTERVEFAIDNPLTNPQISINKEDFINDEEIVIKASADGGVNEYTLTILDNNKSVVKSESFIGHEISLNSKELGIGTYTAQIKCSNYAFDVYTDELTFAVNDSKPEIPDNAQIGDVDGDDKVSVMDATMVQRHIAHLTTISDDRLSCADTDKDGNITIMDATIIQRFVAQLIPQL